MKFDFKSDKETIALFELVVEFLGTYFGYNEQEAIMLVNNFYQFQKQRGLHDDDYHHDGAYRVTCNLQYLFVLKEKVDFNKWAEENHFFNPPIEAINRYNEVFGKL